MAMPSNATSSNVTSSTIGSHGEGDRQAHQGQGSRREAGVGRQGTGRQALVDQPGAERAEGGAPHQRPERNVEATAERAVTRRLYQVAHGRQAEQPPCDLRPAPFLDETGCNLSLVT